MERLAAQALSGSGSGRICSAGCEKLRGDIPEGFELERVPRRVEQEHRRLLARLTRKAYVRLDEKAHGVPPQPLRKRFPLRHLEHHAAVRNGHTVAVDRIEMRGDPSVPAERRVQMADELMSAEVEIHPMLCASPLGASENTLVEGPRLGDVADLQSDVERSE